jgi:hypothetical protein
LQAELEEAAVTGARVMVQLPDSGKEVSVAVGQDWVDASDSGSAAAAADVRKRYKIKWAQDENGALTVLEVVAVLLQSGGSRGEVGMHLAPVAG